MNCTHCKHRLPPNAKFCPECGTAVSQTQRPHSGLFPMMRVRTTPEHYVFEVNGRPYRVPKEQAHNAARTAAAAIGAYFMRRGKGKRGKK